MSSFKLLTSRNPKTNKGRSVGYWTFVLHLAPAKLSGYQVCPMATKGCRAACLNTAGRGGIMAGHGILTEQDVVNGIRNDIQSARIRRTERFFEHRADFMVELVADIERAIRFAQRDGYTPVFRLNGTSDIRWESIPVIRKINGALWSSYPSIMLAFPGVQFYDYTKLANRKHVPTNYALTFSLADGNEAQAIAALDNGMNVAAVFRDKGTVARYMTEGRYTIEQTGFNRFGALKSGRRAPVANGDDTDLRFLDPKGHVIALYAKGNAKKDTSGFVRD